MEWWHAVVLAIVQGLTEFLPVSSSGHLVLVPRVLGWPDQGLAFDVAVHVGTLLAVLLYFRRDLLPLVRGLARFIAGQREDPYGRLAFNLAIGTVPVGFVGLFFKDFIEAHLRSPFVVAFQLAVFGVVLYLADRFGKRARNETQVTIPQALLIGCGQALALVPGTSRSGITMTMGLLSGLTREAAARFAFLLSLPGIALAGGYEGYKVFAGEAGAHAPIAEMLIGVAVSAVVGYACVHYFLRFIARIGFAPFLVYRLLLAGFIVVLFA